MMMIRGGHIHVLYYTHTQHVDKSKLLVCFVIIYWQDRIEIQLEYIACNHKIVEIWDVIRDSLSLRLLFVVAYRPKDLAKKSNSRNSIYRDITSNGIQHIVSKEIKYAFSVFFVCSRVVESTEIFALSLNITITTAAAVYNSFISLSRARARLFASSSFLCVCSISIRRCP